MVRCDILVARNIPQHLVRTWGVPQPTFGGRMRCFRWRSLPCSTPTTCRIGIRGIAAGTSAPTGAAARILVARCNREFPTMRNDARITRGKRGKRAGRRLTDRYFLRGDQCAAVIPQRG